MFEDYNATKKESESSLSSGEDVKEKVAQYLEDHNLDRAFAWRNEQFQDFYFTLKRPYAVEICNLLSNVQEQEEGLTTESLQVFEQLDKDVFNKCIELINKEVEEIKKQFAEVKNVSCGEQSKKLLSEFGLEEKFENTEPLFIPLENCVLALLESDEYDSVAEGTCGKFETDEQIPLITVKIYRNTDELFETGDIVGLDLEKWYIEEVDELVSNIADGNTDEHFTEMFFQDADSFPEEYKAYVRGEKDRDEDGVYEEVHEAVLDAVTEFVPYKLWYTYVVLGVQDRINLRGSVIWESLAISSKQDLNDVSDFFDVQEELNDTITHEVHHSINRFLPVSEMYGTEAKNTQNVPSLTPQEMAQEWTYWFADEVVAHSFEGAEGRVADANTYLNFYEESTEFDTEEERQTAKEVFLSEAAFLTKINQKIVASRARREVSTLFSLEDPRAWKFLDAFLTRGGFKDWGYAADFQEQFQSNAEKVNE